MATQPCLLLDFDNSLMATECLALPSLITRFNALYSEYKLTPEIFEKFFKGQTRESLCASLGKHYGIDVNYELLYYNRERQVMEQFQKIGVEMAPNLIQTLEILRKDYTMALVTNSPLPRVFSAMRFAANGQGDRLARYFGTAFFDANDTPKPAPDVYISAMRQLKTDPTHCFSIEDSATGVRAAVSAGIRTLGFLGFASNAEETKEILTKHGAEMCFYDWGELPSLLKMKHN